MKNYKLQIGDLVSCDDADDNTQYGLVTRVERYENKCWIYWFNKFREKKHNRAMTSISRIKVVSYAEE